MWVSPKAQRVTIRQSGGHTWAYVETLFAMASIPAATRDALHHKYFGVSIPIDPGETAPPEPALSGGPAIPEG